MLFSLELKRAIEKIFALNELYIKDLQGEWNTRISQLLRKRIAKTISKSRKWTFNPTNVEKV